MAKYIKKNRGFGPIPTPPDVRFWRKVEKTDGCWLWQGSRTRLGYGQFGIAARDSRQAHRYAWELTHGPIPEGMCVLHRCDNPPCVNPAHLFLGTKRDNTHDMLAKGRHRVWNRSATTCTHGHEFTPENTRIIHRRTGGRDYTIRHCVTCSRQRSRAARRKAA